MLDTAFSPPRPTVTHDDHHPRDRRVAPSDGPRLARAKPAPTEGPIARAIERRTVQLPSDVFLWSALASMGASLGLQMSDRRHASLFVGQWAAPLLLLGLYNKLVKVAGSDRAH